MPIVTASPKKYDHISLTPPEGVRKAAKRGLELRREFGRGGTAVGVARARDLSNGKSVSPDTAKRMKAYFDRHQPDQKAEGFDSGEKGYPSAGRVAWLLWGGDAGYSWAKKVVLQMEAADKKVSGSAEKPSAGEFARFAGAGECTEVAEVIEKSKLGRKYGLKRVDGGYLFGSRWGEHSWVESPDGTIVDATHGQFDPAVPVLVAEVGSLEHSRYLAAEDMTQDQLTDVYERKPSMAHVVLALHMAADALAGDTSEVDASLATALGLAVGLGLGGQTPTTPSYSNETTMEWTADSLEPELQPIAYLESKNNHGLAHKTHSKGEWNTAYGALGMKPSSGYDQYQKSPSLKSDYPGLDEESFESLFREDTDFYNAVANDHWLGLISKLGTPERAAFAWRFGRGAALNATDEEIKAAPYVKAYMRLLGESSSS